MEWLPLDFFISDVYTELCVHCTQLYPLGVWEGGEWRVDRRGLEIALQCSHVQKPVTKPVGAKKISFTACHSGKLKLAFTSPDVISTSPKNVLTSRID